ncbi:MAG: GNAT family N-acetyltransferase [Sedimentibacter saalensis]|uniref:GNAT family N-acetyltransferase n=1 Tax=Sedimentibacter saalensis TaxID=130788 RepID=UPI0031596D34
MKYEIRKLNAELALTFADYLGNLDFGHAPHWATCFCRYYHTNCSRDEWQQRSGATNRQEAIENIESGKMKGYLAFDDNKCIGWCNANNVNEYLRLKDDLEALIKDKKTGCVICFVIYPEYRGQGVARQLLKQAIEDFKVQGYEAVIALPIENKNEPEKLYRGTLNMYKENGFKEIEKQDNMSIMWLDIRKDN